MASNESQLRQELDDLQKKLGKKQQFEAAVASISSIVKEQYASASPSLRNSVIFLFFLRSFSVLDKSCSVFVLSVADCNYVLLLPSVILLYAGIKFKFGFSSHL